MYLARAKKRYQAFTLVELMIVVVVIAILAAVAIPSYQKSVVKGKRAAAQAQMLDIAGRQQQYFLANREYANKSALESSGYSPPADVAAVYEYDITPGSGTVPSFTIKFTGKGSQAADGELTLNNEGVKTPLNKW